MLERILVAIGAKVLIEWGNLFIKYLRDLVILRKQEKEQEAARTKLEEVEKTNPGRAGVRKDEEDYLNS